ncbi:MAG: NCS2 family permease [Myxococcales bacterium]|nr:NCS2 family permease [Myxococcales bacterium]
MRWFTRGDIDGFFGLALDNLVQLLLIQGLCTFVLGLPTELVAGRILPGAALSILVGNAFYSWQAHKLAAQTGRTDICALPYGINTISLFAHVFLVMLPAKLVAEAAGAEDPARVAWIAGVWACIGSGLIEFFGAFVADFIRRLTPRAALLSTLSGIALGFISLGFLFRTFANPLVGLATFGITLLTYFGRVKFKGGLPGGLVAVGIGTAIAWASGLAPVGPTPTEGLSLHLPVPVTTELLSGASTLWTYFSVVLPMGIFNVVGSLQNIESAEAAGDAYPTKPSLAWNGVSTLVAGLLGSCFPTTIYIGHPGWKAMGARAGYSVLNGVFVCAICLTGALSWLAWAVPVDAGMAIVLWIGIVITAQAFQAVSREHAPAVVMGLLPGVGAWGALMAKNGLRAAGAGTPEHPFTPDLIEAFHSSDTWIHGAFALEQGFIFTAMVLGSITVSLIDRAFHHAAVWALLGAALSLTGLMHGYAWTPSDTVVALTPGWSWAAGYGVMALVFGLAPWVTEQSEGH